MLAGLPEEALVLAEAVAMTTAAMMPGASQEEVLATPTATTRRSRITKMRLPLKTNRSPCNSRKSSQLRE